MRPVGRSCGGCGDARVGRPAAAGAGGKERGERAHHLEVEGAAADMKKRESFFFVLFFLDSVLTESNKIPVFLFSVPYDKSREKVSGRGWGGR